MIPHLLHYANASPPHATREEFYSLKGRLLDRWAKRDGYDVQHIPGKHCWSCDGTGGLYEPGGCYKCMGDGWFKRPRWVTLERFRFGRFVFHSPRETSYRKPEPEVTHIEGYIRHSEYGATSDEAVLWLYLLCGEFRLFWRQWRADESFRPRWWKHPLCTAARTVSRLRRLLPNRAAGVHEELPF